MNASVRIKKADVKSSVLLVNDLCREMIAVYQISTPVILESSVKCFSTLDNVSLVYLVASIRMATRRQ